MDYQALWGVHPWAQVSYNQSLASYVWVPMTRAREGGWSDVTLGADMRLGSHVAAWATLSQADNPVSYTHLDVYKRQRCGSGRLRHSYAPL